MERYLSVPGWHVAYVTMGHTSVTEEVRTHARYLKPAVGRGQAPRTHFLWSDFYADLRALTAGPRTNPTLVALRGLFDYHCLEPAHELIGDLGVGANEDVSATAREHRKNLQQAMDKTCAWAKHEYGWRPEPRENGETYLFSPDRHCIVWVSARHVPGVLRLWFQLDSPAEQRRLLEVLPMRLGPALGWRVSPQVVPGVGEWWPVAVHLPLRMVLSGLSTYPQVGARLRRVISRAIITAVDMNGRPH